MLRPTFVQEQPLYAGVFHGVDFIRDRTGGPYRMLRGGSYAIRSSTGGELLPGRAARSAFLVAHYARIEWDNASGLAQFLADATMGRNLRWPMVIPAYARWTASLGQGFVIKPKVVDRLAYKIFAPKVFRNDHYASVIFISLHGWMHLKCTMFMNRIRLDPGSGITRVTSRRMAWNVFAAYPSVRY